MRLYLMVLGTMTSTQAPVPGYLIQTDAGDNVLVDTGYRPSGNPDEPISVAGEQELLQQLGAIGVRPGDVRYVVCSHFDPDHAGNHDLFPDSEFVVQREHYEAARAGSIPRLGLARQHWDAPGLRYKLIDGESTLLPGIELVESGGHVPGHQSVLVRLPNTGPVLLAIDAIPMAIAMDPGQRPVFPFDLDEAALRDSTGKLVALAAKENALIIHGHDAAQWATLHIAPGYYD
ncbi:MAG TPA: N-acyl homoserine lactonase family protein [Pseudonocardiaceae bacterium]|nr:N-acyl homoserine lactonase family protein [Pseudonocardiaceae bacterium]